MPRNSYQTHANTLLDNFIHKLEDLGCQNNVYTNSMEDGGGHSTPIIKMYVGERGGIIDPWYIWIKLFSKIFTKKKD